MFRELADNQIQLSVHGSELRVHAPQGKLTDALRQQIRQQKAALIAELTLSNARAGSAVIPRTDATVAPLSVYQRGLWLTANMALVDESSYNMPLSVSFKGRFGPDAFREALFWMAERHQLLRCCVQEAGQEVVLSVSTQPLCYHYVDLTTSADPVAEASTRVKADANTPFDLTGLLWRAMLLQLAADHYVFACNFHHLIMDGHSLELFKQELLSAYIAFSHGRRPAVTDLPIQYLDYCLWQRQHKGQAEQQRQLAYWQQKLSLLPEPLQFHPFAPTEIVPKVAGSAKMALEPAVSDAITGFCRQHQTTHAVFFYSLFSLLLARAQDRSDIVLGTPVSHRDQTQLQGLLGYFVNTLVLRSQIDEQQSFVSLLAQAKETYLQAFDHKDVAFEELVTQLVVERQQDQHPIFQVLYSFHREQNIAESTEYAQHSALEVSAFGSRQLAPKFPLAFYVVEKSTGFRLELVFDQQRVAEPWATQMLEQMAFAIPQLLQQCDTGLQQLHLLPKTQTDTVLSWGQTKPLAASDDGYLQTFARLAQMVPHRTAVSCDTTHFTFAQLAQRSDQLAATIQAMGVTSGAVVALYSRKCSRSILAMLACWKAGVAYLPLDVRHPPERIGQILDKARVSLVLSEATSWSALQRPEQMLDLFDESQWLVADAVPQLGTVAPDALAYVIFTSGSTGTPKGVAVSHGAILNQGRAVQQQILNAGDWYREETNIAVNASLVFDVSVTQIVQLYFGATLRLVTDEQKQDLEQLWNFWQSYPIAVFDCTPSYFQLILDTMDATLLRYLPKCFLVAGEGISEAMWQRLQRLAQTTGCRIFNAYGPTECTVYASYCDLAACSTQPQIGGPLSANQLFILDRHRRLMPPGCTGELYVGGAGLATGYYHAEELTRERFVNIMLADNRTHRLYRTGDLVCWDHQGQLIYKGRTDNQIKLRGFRVELDDIVHAISHIPGIRQAAVRLFQHNNDQQLVAYYLSADGQALDSVDLTAALQEKLPFYMLPNQWIQVERMPMTINGKLDMRALPAPGQVEQCYVAPADEIEIVLAQIWQELTGQPQISVEQSLWHFGVHSLLFMWASMKLQNQLKLKVSVKELFDRSTIRLQAALCRERLLTGNAVELAIRRRGELQAPMSYRQLSFWLSEALSPPDTGDFNMSYSVLIKGPLDVGVLKESFVRLIARHETLRTNVIRNDNQQQLSVQPAHRMNWQFWDFRRHIKPDAAIENIVQNEHLRSFDLQYELPLRLHVFQLANDKFVLCMTMHHLFSDGWSMQVIRKDLVRIYTALSEQREPELPELSVQYNDYAYWLNQQYQAGELSVQKEYWRVKLADLSPQFYPPLPELIEQIPVKTVVKELQLGPVLSQRLRQLAAQNNTTIYATLLASYQLMLTKVSGITDVVVVTPFAERESPELEQLVGFFVNTLILRNQIDMNADFITLVRQVRDCCVEAFSNAQIGYHEVIAMAREINGNATLLDDNIMFAFKRVELSQAKTATLFENWEISPYFDYVRHNVGRMTCSWLDNGAELKCSMMFRQDLVSDEFQQLLFDHYLQLLTNLVQAPQQALQDVPWTGKPLAQAPQLSAAINLDASDALSYVSRTAVLTEEQLQIRNLWAKLLCMESQDIDLDTEFFRYGGHSLLTMELLAALRLQFGIEGDAAALLRSNTVRKQEQYLRSLQHSAPKQVQCKVQMSGNPLNEPILFLAPALGASVSSYQSLVAALAADFRIGLLSTPGIDQFTTAENDCHDWPLNSRLRQYLHNILTHQPEGPYTLLGHSFGGNIMFELAVLLELRGHQVQLILLDSILGAIDPAETPMSTSQFMQSRLPGSVHYRIADQSSALTPSELFSQLRLCGLMPDSFSEEAFGGYLRAVQSQLQFYYSYHPSNRLAGKVTLIEATQGLAIHPRQHQIRKYIQQYATETIRIVEAPGSHVGVAEHPALASIIKNLMLNGSDTYGMVR
ncbi:hypothetical protein A5320_02610 [Rheinheimera sp. SA_1]|uniref:non-ribosomal peptide synthetase n=1 Tax=Rheinheimera sp. SA_1 TaxID=1827365 RepID=UPI0007FFFF9A|nr:non-ribosomal peptide synthetase [Rheinheimera sp. SA_1]OBP16319.1 hypothetical protein A5320_02610 [Rheinheimera sp. SA_1]